MTKRATSSTNQVSTADLREELGKILGDHPDLAAEFSEQFLPSSSSSSSSAGRAEAMEGVEVAGGAAEAAAKDAPTQDQLDEEYDRLTAQIKRRKWALGTFFTFGIALGGLLCICNCGIMKNLGRWPVVTGMTVCYLLGPVYLMTGMTFWIPRVAICINDLRRRAETHRRSHGRRRARAANNLVDLLNTCGPVSVD